MRHVTIPLDLQVLARERAIFALVIITCLSVTSYLSRQVEFIEEVQDGEIPVRTFGTPYDSVDSTIDSVSISRSDQAAWSAFIPVYMSILRQFDGSDCRIMEKYASSRNIPPPRS